MIRLIIYVRVRTGLSSAQTESFLKYGATIGNEPNTESRTVEDSSVTHGMTSIVNQISMIHKVMSASIKNKIPLSVVATPL